MKNDILNDESQGLSNPDTWVDRHGDALYSFALARLRDPIATEDIVQETFLAALRQRNSYAGRSNERTWMIGILKHKIIDYFRRSAREQTNQESDLSENEIPTEFYNEGLLAGTWLKETRPNDWRTELSDEVERSEFRKFLEKCLEYLKPLLRKVFVLREMEELKTEEICNILDISPTNLRVALHRGRSRLRSCLENNWLKG